VLYGVRNTSERPLRSDGAKAVELSCKSRADRGRELVVVCPHLRAIRAVILHSKFGENMTLANSNPSDLMIPSQAESDSQLLELWLHGRSRHTQRAYRADAERFLLAVDKRLYQVTLSDLQGFADGLSDLQPATRQRIISSIKSLFAFVHRLGYLPFDVARPLRLTGLRNELSERILDEGEVQRMLALEPNPRNQAILVLLYASGVRASELCGLRWSDLQKREEGGQVSIFGKGQKTRVVLLPKSVWVKLMSLRNDVPEDGPLFRSRKKGHLSAAQVWRIVVRASQRAGISKAVSTHWLRHAHASHSLDRGAPISLVQATLGHASVATTGRYLHARPSDSSARYLQL
jgi:site-specific recombinase XerD